VLLTAVLVVVVIAVVVVVVALVLAPPLKPVAVALPVSPSICMMRGMNI
jgi:hypothetical protein